MFLISPSQPANQDYHHPHTHHHDDQVWARVHHSRPIPDHLLQAALKALDVAPDKVESVARVSSILMET